MNDLEDENVRLREKIEGLGGSKVSVHVVLYFMFL